MLTKIKGFVRGLVEWSSRHRDPRDRSIEGIIKRNYRTWMGHTAVVTSILAVAKLLSLLAALVSPLLATLVLVVAIFGGNGYYFNREFGKNGNYWEAKGLANSKLQKDKELDSIGDFLIPAVVSVFAVYNFNLIAILALPALIVVVMVTLKSMDDEV